MKHENGKLKTPSEDRIFNVDPTGLTPVSSGANADMLLHTPRAQVHRNSVNKRALFYKKAPLLAPDFSPWWTTSAFDLEYSKDFYFVNRPCG